MENRLAALDRSLHEIDATVIFHKITVAVGNPEQILKNIEGILALILDVMDGENRTDKLIFGAEAVDRLEVERSQSRLPVMTMQDIGIEIEEGQNLHDAAAEERKAFPVVVIAVASGTFEVIFIVHKIELYVVLLILKDTAILIAPGQRNKNVSDELEILAVFLFVS